MTIRIALLVLVTAIVAGCGKPADEAPPAAAAAPGTAMEPTEEAMPEAEADDSVVPTRIDEIERELTATVVEIDHETRAVYLQDDDGNMLAFRADDDIERLEEISAGDRVHIKHHVSLAMELRAPTEEELAEPLAVSDDVLRAVGTQPAGIEVRTVRAVAEIVGIDMPSETATLQGPDGNLVMVKAADPENLKSVSIGDTVIVTYMESLAVAIEKVQ